MFKLVATTIALLVLSQTIGCERASDRLPDSRDWRCQVHVWQAGERTSEWVSIRTSWDAGSPTEVEHELDRDVNQTSTCHRMLLTRRDP